MLLNSQLLFSNHISKVDYLKSVPECTEEKKIIQYIKIVTHLLASSSTFGLENEAE